MLGLFWLQRHLLTWPAFLCAARPPAPRARAPGRRPRAPAPPAPVRNRADAGAARRAGTAMRAATLAIALPPLLQAGPGSVLRGIPADLRPTGNRRAALYAALAALFFVEAWGLLAAPKTFLRACTGSYGNAPAQLVFELVALSTHVLVPAAALCLKVRRAGARALSLPPLLTSLLRGARRAHCALAA